jgi:hypothetical protein
MYSKVCDEELHSAYRRGLEDCPMPENSGDFSPARDLGSGH